MNLPNKLTIFRVILVPVFLIFLLGPFGYWSNIVAAIVFIVASATDMLDG